MKRPMLALALVAFAACATALEARTFHTDVVMTDGSALRTSVYLPETGEEPWPALLVRSCYGRYIEASSMLEKPWARKHYAIVAQDVRSWLPAEPRIEIFLGDGWREGLNDAHDTAAWIHEQPWCDGKIGVFGASAQGILAGLAGAATPLIDTQYIAKAPASLYHHAVFHGGVFREHLARTWLSAIEQDHTYRKYRSFPHYGPAWHPHNTLRRIEHLEGPALFSGSWYDVFQQGTLDAFMAREQSENARVQGKSYLILSDGSHRKTLSKDYRPRVEGRPDTGAIQRAWFDCHLRENCAELESISRVHYVVMGADKPRSAPGNEWRTADTWPPVPTTLQAWHLQHDGGIALSPPERPGSVSFEYDPRDPYPTLGGPNLSYALPIGPFDQRKYSETRDDLVQFATAPLEAPLEVTGRVAVRLYVSSDAPDTDFTAKLIDVYPEPDGRAINLLDGVRRLRARRSLEQPADYTPGDIVELEIDLWSTSFIFAAGHRIGVHISSSNAPRFAVNPNTGDDYLDTGVTPRVATNRVHFGPGHPSALLLPVAETPAD